VFKKLTKRERKECPPELQAVGEQLSATVAAHERRCYGMTREERKGRDCGYCEKTKVCLVCRSGAGCWMHRFLGLLLVQIQPVVIVQPQDDPEDDEDEK
jgi:hypothetical protein